MSPSFLPLVAAVCCMLVAAAQSANVPGTRSIINPPQNEAFEYGPGVTLNCEASGPTERVQWTEYATSSVGAPISDGTDLLPGHPNYARYQLNNPPGSAIFDLTINPTLMADGGTYRCQDISDSSSPAYMQLVMLDGPPQCTTNIPLNGYVLEGEYYTIECQIGYRGNAAPKMFFTGPDLSNGYWGQIVTTTNVSVFGGASMNMTRYFDAHSFSILTNFTEAGFINPSSASNIPTWNYTFSSASLFVQWVPQKMYRVPEQDTYEIGDTIECWADANPDADYYWRNLDTMETWAGHKLFASDLLVGSQRMQCHANNTINGLPYTGDYFFNFTVNPRTTTPTPTTPTTTTPPLPEAPCDDLTGRWTATTPTRVDVCLSLNNANGRIVGLFRNATDPYFIEIRGRFKPYTYSQVGFAGVWPVNIGTLAFNAVCRKCYGVEILQVTAVGRKVTDNPSCVDFGQKYLFPNYAFERTGPPCTGLFQEYSVKL